MTGVALGELAEGGGQWPDGGLPIDWIEEMSLLLETQVVSCLHDMARGRAALLLECRQALQIREGNVAVLVVEGVSSLSWAERDRRGPVMAWSVVGGYRRQEGGQLQLRLQLFRGGLTISARRAALHVLEVAGLPEAPVDYGSEDDAIRAGTPNWESTGALVASYRF